MVMENHQLSRIVGEELVTKGGVASREAWEFLDALDLHPTRKEKAKFVDHAFNEIVNAVLKKLGKVP